MENKKLETELLMNDNIGIYALDVGLRYTFVLYDKKQFPEFEIEYLSKYELKDIVSFQVEKKDIPYPYQKKDVISAALKRFPDQEALIAFHKNTLFTESLYHQYRECTDVEITSSDRKNRFFDSHLKIYEGIAHERQFLIFRDKDGDELWDKDRDICIFRDSKEPAFQKYKEAVHKFNEEELAKEKTEEPQRNPELEALLNKIENGEIVLDETDLGR